MFFFLLPLLQVLRSCASTCLMSLGNSFIICNIADLLKTIVVALHVRDRKPLIRWGREGEGKMTPLDDLMRPFPWITWVILWTHKAKTPSSYRSQTEEQWELRTLTACRQWGITRNPHGFVLSFLLSPVSQILCPSSSLLISDLPPSSLLLLTLLIHILHFCYSPTAKSVLTNSSVSPLLPYYLSHLSKCF